MAKYKAKIRIGLMVTLIVCVILCPLAWGGYSVHYAALAQEKRDDPIEFTPHVTAIVITVTPEPVLKSTVGPGQYFEEDDLNRPEVHYIERGDERFGYGPLEDDPGLYLMWFTDEDGKHYRIVGKDSEVLFGTVDPDTNQRRDDGFNELVRRRKELKEDLADLDNKMLGEARLSDGMFAVSAIILGGGLIICIFATAGACSIALPIAGPTALGFAGLGVENGIDHRNLSEERDTVLERIDDVEYRLSSRFDLPETESIDS